MNERRTHSPEFKTKVAMEAICGRNTIQEIAADHANSLLQCCAPYGATRFN
ncbi:MAG: hypothetical protein ACK59A_15010 [Cyanobacteriota bacterium]